LIDKLFGKVEAFENREFDMLAEKMLVTKQLRKKKPYVFSSRVWLNAKATRNHVEFSKELYKNLTDKERLAIAAHEFGHIRERHHLIKFKRIFIPSAVASFPVFMVGLEINPLFFSIFYVLPCLFSYCIMQST
jgi:Zn-dependent protease with chaperone function